EMAAVRISINGTPTNVATVGDRQNGFVMAVDAQGDEVPEAGFYVKGPFGQQEPGTSAATNGHTGLGFTGAGAPNTSGGYVYLRNRWYDPQTGRFLSQDPIGLAGGVNLYAYAGNNPTTYSDPFGLKVEFHNAEARRLYGKLKQDAEQASASDDESAAAAGAALLAQLTAIEAEEQIVRVSVAGSGFIKRLLGWNNGFGTRDGGEFGIIVDPNNPAEYRADVRLAHELGHAYSAMVDEQDVRARDRNPTNNRALELENNARTIY